MLKIFTLKGTGAVLFSMVCMEFLGSVGLLSGLSPALRVISAVALAVVAFLVIGKASKSYKKRP